jgi:hypothetical protein
MSTRPPSETSDWEEQDLLTLDEAGQRLHDEVGATRLALAEADDDGERLRLEQRIEALTAALDRIGRGSS